MGKLRIGLTISGAVSLGAFEGGALAALLLGIQAVQRRHPEAGPELTLDSVGAASAGAITGVLAARILTSGLDPVWAMQEAWVREDSVETLLKGAGGDAPLTMAGLRDMAIKVLSPGAERVDGDAIQQAQVVIQLALTNLRGLDYQISGISAPSAQRGGVDATTYLDWGLFSFQPGDPVNAFTEPPGRSAVDVALASGASPLGFPPRYVQRDADDYAGQGLLNFPAAANGLWYTDGGTIDNEPLAQTLGVSNQIDETSPLGQQDHRLQLLIHPFPTSPPASDSTAWANASSEPTWLNTLLRAFAIIRAQNLYADIRQAEKVNSQLIWQARLLTCLGGLVSSLPAAEQNRWLQQLSIVASGIDTDLAHVHRHRRPLLPPAAQSGTSVPDLLNALFERISGLAGKNIIGIEVVSPYTARGTAGIPLDRLLAGDFLESFGGFFHEGLRRSDFALGFVSMLNWMESGFGRYGLAAELQESTLDAALTAFYNLETWAEDGQAKGWTDYGLTDTLLTRADRLGLQAGPSWTPTYFGQMSVGSLPWREKFLFGRVAARIAATLGRDLFASGST